MLAQDYTELVDNFKNALEAQGYSTQYFYNTRHFLAYMEHEGIELDDLTIDKFNRFILALDDKYANETINMYIKAVKKFYDYLFSIGVVSPSVLDVFLKTKYRPLEYKQKDYITKEDLYQVIEMGKTFCDWMSEEKYDAMFWFMFYTGLRRTELMELKRKDIDFKNRIAIIREPKASGRVKYQRIVPFPVKVARHLKEYFQTEEEDNNCFNLTRKKIDRLFEHLKEFCPGKNLTPHALRHSFARYLHEKGLDIKTIQKLMGHKNLNSTQVYVDPDIKTCVNLYNERIK